MRAAITIAAFAAGALAIPYKRDNVVYDTNVVYVTNVVTVTAGEAAPTPVAYQAPHYGHGHGHGHQHESSSVEQVTSVVAPTSTVEPETSSAPAYTPPATTSSTQPAYSAPTHSSSSSAANAAPTDYQGKVIYHHNIHRANHSAPNVDWNQDLADWAQTIAARCIFKHANDVGSSAYGQNIAAGTEPDNIGYIITEQFYNCEMENFAGSYGQANPTSGFESWGHFSQMVWKDTTHVGCATVSCPGGVIDTTTGQPFQDMSNWNTVCNYAAPGNYGGEYANNIGEPQGHPFAAWDAPASY